MNLNACHLKHEGNLYKNQLDFQNHTSHCSVNLKSLSTQLKEYNKDIYSWQRRLK